FLYPTARTYYQAAREHDRLQAELTAVIQRNAKMAQKIDVLQTDEGIIQEAREQLGWVERGEYAVIVYGTGKEPEPDVDADIVSGTIKPPVTWYSPVLDIIFGVK
ncbi:MAG: septum formation initiator family protein, partial [Eggerthellaceae bacterium]|nr:septum formation initiator family protein [Eggerthellaceae bacterium]